MKIRLIIIFFITHLINSGIIIYLSKRELKKEAEAQKKAQKEAQEQIHAQALAQGIDYLFINHKSGLFSGINIRFLKICSYYNNIGRLPDIVDSSSSFNHYHSKRNVSLEIFKINSYKDKPLLRSKIKLTSDNKDLQFSNYKKLNFDHINPILTHYFTPGYEIQQKIIEIETKYKIDYNNTICLFYRGNDKSRETNLPTYSDFNYKLKNIIESESQFLIQSDETEFLNYFQKLYPKKCLIFEDEIRHISKSDTTVEKLPLTSDKKLDFTYNFIAIVIIMSKCKKIILTSGNISQFIVMYRGNSNNIHQYLSPKEYIHGYKNLSYDPNQTDFWL